MHDAIVEREERRGNGADERVLGPRRALNNARVSRRGGSPAALLRLAAPLRSRPFRRLAGGLAIVVLADWVAVPALVAWVYERSGSTGVAMLLLARLAPPLLGSGAAALLADRLPRGRLLLASEAAYAVCTGVVLLGVVRGSVVLALLALAATGALSAVSVICTQSLVPQLVPDDQLPAANSLLATASNVATAAGAVAGGAAVAATGIVPALAVGAALGAAAVPLFLGLGSVPAAAAPRESGVGEGLRQLARSRDAVAVVAAFVLAIVATGIVNATLPRLLNDELGLGDGGYGFGFAALAGGIALGAACSGATSARPRPALVGVAIVAMGVLIGLLAAAPAAAAALALLGAVGLANGVAEVLMVTIVQRETDPAYHGRAFAAATALMRIALVGSLLAAPLVERAGGARTVVLGAGVWLVLAGLVCVLGSLRKEGSDVPVVSMA